MWFTRVSINNPVFATMVMAALCVLGLFSYSQLRVELVQGLSETQQLLGARFDNLKEGAPARIAARGAASGAAAAPTAPAASASAAAKAS